MQIPMPIGSEPRPSGIYYPKKVAFYEVNRQLERGRSIIRLVAHMIFTIDEMLTANLFMVNSSFRAVLLRFQQFLNCPNVVCQLRSHCWRFAIQRFLNTAKVDHSNEQRNRVVVIFQFL
jgi:hypothetical protein